MKHLCTKNYIKNNSLSNLVALLSFQNKRENHTFPVLTFLGVLRVILEMLYSVMGLELSPKRSEFLAPPQTRMVCVALSQMSTFLLPNSAFLKWEYSSFNSNYFTTVNW